MTTQQKRILSSVSDRMAMAIFHAALVPVVSMALLWIAITWLMPQLNTVVEPSQLPSVAYGVYVTASFIGDNVSISICLLAAAGFLIGRFLARKPR